MIEPIKIKKEEIHKKIDDTFNSITKNMGSLFDKIKFNEIHQVEETNNLEIMTSVESIAITLQDLVKIVNDMKVECLKKNEFDNNYRKNLQKDIHKNINEINQKISQLQENYNYVNSLIKENRNNKHYKYSLNFNMD